VKTFSQFDQTVGSPTFILPRNAGEERGGGLNPSAPLRAGSA
jgi:hypothetical protein